MEEILWFWHIKINYKCIKRCELYQRVRGHASDVYSISCHEGWVFVPFNQVMKILTCFHLKIFFVVFSSCIILHVLFVIFFLMNFNKFDALFIFFSSKVVIIYILFLYLWCMQHIVIDKSHW